MGMVAIDWNPAPKALRSFGLIGVVAFAALAVLADRQALLFSALPDAAANPTAYVLAGLAAYCGVFALAAPRALRPLYLGLSIVGFPIGFVFSYVILAAMYFLIIVPIGLVFRIIGRDAMNRHFDSRAASYWIRRSPPANIERYFRQF